MRTTLRGRFNVENVLGVIAAAILLDVDEDEIAAGIAALRGVPGRFEAVDEGSPSPSSSTMRTSRTRSTTSCGRRATSPAGVSSSSSAPAATATDRSGR